MLKDDVNSEKGGLEGHVTEKLHPLGSFSYLPQELHQCCFGALNYFLLSCMLESSFIVWCVVS